jgi:uncharacterized membrane protein YedE/YeeE
MLMLAVAVGLFAPALASGTLFGVPVRGSVSPLSLAVIAGAFLFGVGMQLGGGCASGTLYAAGGGSVRMLVTLAAFIGGSLLGTAHAHLWSLVPSMQAVSLIDSVGPAMAVGVSFAGFGMISWGTTVLERKRHGRLISPADGAVESTPGRRLVSGPWPLVWGALGLALVNFLALWFSGRPWGITSAFALWGAKAAAMAGVNVAGWPYWSEPARAAQLTDSVFRDGTSVMNFGIMIGAFLAAGLRGRLDAKWRVPVPSLAAAILGGILMGYGARIGYGCNIGAYFGGIASTSLHGWLWLAAGLAGTVAGTKLRPRFGLRV